MQKPIRIDRLFLFCGVLLSSCGAETLEPASTAPSSGIFDAPASHSSAPPAMDGEVRKVLVHEVLNGGKYEFLDAQEMSGERYWIATVAGGFVAGGTYAFSKGLLKTGYRSEALDRTFANLYLVSDLRPTHAESSAHGTSSSTAASVISPDLARHPGSLTIAEVVDGAAELAGTRVTITAHITKVNPEIMDRNWYHLKDGTRDDYDFVATSSDQVPSGHTVTFEGLISVNRDFGAGYKYALIMENAELVK